MLCLLCFEVVVMPFWPDKWTYAPEFSSHEITARWPSFVPERTRRNLGSVRVAITLVFVGFVLYLHSTSSAGPWFTVSKPLRVIDPPLRRP